MSQEIYYLLSQNNTQEISNFEEIMSKYEYVDPNHMDNFFEVIQINATVLAFEYKIIKIYKNLGTGKFKPNDIIYFSGGMLSFYTKNPDGKIDQGECFPTVLIKKEKITLFDESESESESKSKSKSNTKTKFKTKSVSTCNSTCDSNCENILSYLKYSNPKDFCHDEMCLKWGNKLEECKFCSVNTSKKFCNVHITNHHVIECFYCGITNCIEKYHQDNWTKLSNTRGYVCSTHKCQKIPK